MKIKDGYNGKEMVLRIASQGNGSIEMWIEHSDILEGKEVLTYMTAEELLALFQEVKNAGRDLFC